MHFNLKIMKKILISSIAISALTLISCKTDFDRDVNNMTVSNGTANFSKYVALGNSLTSGYRDGALYIDGQNESYPSMIAKQMSFAGGSQTFNQPLMEDNNGGLLLPVSATTNLQIADTKLYLKEFVGGSPVLENINGNVATNVFKSIYNTSTPFQNLGVPGAKSYHLLYSGYGNPAGIAAKTANPYYARFASSATSKVIDDAMTQNPTFFSLWIGNNDTLGYATNGGDVTLDQITPKATFDAAYTGLITTLTSKGAKGVVANLPYVTSIPFFTTVPYKPVPGTKLAANIADLTTLYGQLKSALAYLGVTDRIVEMPSAASTDYNRVLMKDETLTDLSAQLTAVFTASGMNATQAAVFGQIYGKARQSRPSDLILLSTPKILGTTAVGAPSAISAYGITYPLEDKHVLLPSEATEINTAIDGYNATIKSLADSKGLAFVDANSKMIQLSQQSGIQFDGVRYTASFIKGGTFSLDGVHLTGRGYALIANEFIKAINKKYGSTLPQVNVNSYSGVTFP